jgi:hypothetical protein
MPKLPPIIDNRDKNTVLEVGETILPGLEKLSVYPLPYRLVKRSLQLKLFTL